MDKKTQTKLISGNAFKIFRVELDRYRKGFEEFLKLGGSQDPAMLKKFSASFHTIRGGAGFFGLDDIATFAGTLEDLLGSPSFDLKKDLPEAQEVFSRLTSSAAKILEEA